MTNPAPFLPLLALISISGCAHGTGGSVPENLYKEASQRPAETTPGSARTGELGGIEFALNSISKQIVSHLDEQKKSAIAVLGFTDESGGESAFGRFIAEELTTRLFYEKRFTVIERRMLEKILQEQRMETTALVDPGSAKQLGKLLGVDAIATGTYTDLGATVRLNARLISAEQGTVFAAAGGSLPCDASVARLHGCVGGGPGESNQAGEGAVSRAPKDPGAITSPSAGGRRPPGVLLFEDFSSVPEGALPTGWTGGDDMIVGAMGRSKALHVASSNGKENTVTVPIPGGVPRSYRVDLVGTISSCCMFQWIGITVGGVAVRTNESGWLKLGGELTVGSRSRESDSTVLIEKRGPVLQVFLDGQRRFLKRLPESAPGSDEISITLQGTPRGPFLRRVKMVTLDE